MPYGQKDDSAILRFRKQLNDTIERAKELDLARIEADKQRQINTAINEHLQTLNEAPVSSYGDLYRATRQANVNLEQLGPRGTQAAENNVATAKLFKEPDAVTTTGADAYHAQQFEEGDLPPGEKERFRIEPKSGKRIPIAAIYRWDRAQNKLVDTGVRKLKTAIGENADGGGGGFDPTKTKINATWSYKNAKGELVDHPLTGTPQQMSASLQIAKENLRKNVLSKYPFDLAGVKNGDISSVEKYKADKTKAINSLQEKAAIAKSEAERLLEEEGEQSAAYKKMLETKETLNKEIDAVRNEMEVGETTLNAWRSAIEQESSLNQMGGGVGVLNPNAGPAPIKRTPQPPKDGAPIKVNTIAERDKLPSGTLYIGPDGKTRRRK